MTYECKKCVFAGCVLCEGCRFIEHPGGGESKPTRFVKMIGERYRRKRKTAKSEIAKRIRTGESITFGEFLAYNREVEENGETTDISE